MMLHEIINDFNIPEFQLVRHQVNLYFVEFGTGVEQCINLVFFTHMSSCLRFLEKGEETKTNRLVPGTL